MKIPKLLFICMTGLAPWCGAQNIEQVLQQDPFDISGSISTHTQFYNTNAPANRSTPFGWNVQGRANIVVYGFSMPIGFTVGRVVRSFNVPVFTQLGMSPSYKWATAHLGHRNMQFSKYTLNNHTFLGAGVELNPGIFRFAAMSGQLRKSFREVDIENTYIEPVFKRSGHAVKIGIGKKENYLDLIYFRAKDHEGSLDLPDSTNLHAAENTALGVRGRLTFDKKVTLDADVGLSGYTRNQESLSFDSADIAEDLAKVGKIYEPKLSSQVGLAMNTSVHYKYRGFYIGAQFERVEPAYQTMGSYFFNNDFQNITAKAGWAMFDHRIRFDGSFGLQENNVRNDKATTNKRHIGSANLAIRPSDAVGIVFNYSNYSQDQEPGRLAVNDTVRISTATHNVSFTPSFTMGSSVVVGSVNIQQSDDRNPFNEEFADVNSLYATLNYSYVFMKGKASMNAGIHMNDITFGDQQQKGKGLSGGYTQNLLGGKIRLAVQGTMQMNRINDESNGNNWNLSLHQSYQVTEKQSFSVMLGYLESYSIFAPKLKEFRGRVGYQYVFK